MDSSSKELDPTKGAVLAFLDFLVDPLLPSRPSSRETLSFSQELWVSRQVHAVVLLYNYHHRKQHPDLEFLDFQSFCKLAVALKPSLKLYFRLMERTDYAELDDKEKHVSLTERAIMNACETSKCLDASNNDPIIDGWPVTKVAVILVDSRKENCYLFHGAITKGVWSAIEKEVNVPNQGSEAVAEVKSANKKKRVIRRAPKENKTADGTGLEQLAYLAVKESCGINQFDLKILENHLVYSTSKAKTAVRLFIMQCMRSTHDANLVPINDVMDSLRGPLVRKDSVSWIFTPVVEYFHLLPFADKLSDCLRREMSFNSSQHFEAAKEDVNCKNFHLQVEQSSDPSYHVKAVKDIANCSGFSSKKERLLNIIEQSCAILDEEAKSRLNKSKVQYTIPHLKEEPNLNVSESLGATQEVINGNSKHLKEEIVPYDSNYTEVSEVRDFDRCHLEEPLPNTSQHFVVVKLPSGAVEELKNGNSYHLKEESLPTALEAVVKSPSGAVEELKNGNSYHLNEESLPTASEAVVKSPSGAVEELKNGNSYHLKEKSLPIASQASEAVEVFQNVSSFCINKEPCPYNSQHPEAEKVVNNISSSHRRKETIEPVVYRKRNRSQKNSISNKNPGSKTINALTDYPRQAKEQCVATASSNNMDILAQRTDQMAVTGGAIIVTEFPATSSNERDVEKILSDNRISDTAMQDQDERQDCALVTFDTDYKHLRKIHHTIASKEKLISQTALNVLYRKREQLSLQARNITDEIALCDRSIQTILSGGEDELAVKIDSIVEGCNETCLRTAAATEDLTALCSQDQDFPPVVKRKRLSEANLCVQSPCQELDGICNNNFWILPTYSLSALEGGFQAIVTVKGVDFEYSSEGTIHATPQEARNSAASNILAKLRSVTAKS